MQTSIVENLALGIAGEHANTEPWYAEPYIASTDVTMGSPAGMKSDKSVGPYNATYSTYIGLFVSPHEHVKFALPSDARSLAVKGGDTIAVAKRGVWFIPQTTAETKFSHGDKLKLASYAYAIAGVGDTAVAEVVYGDADTNVVGIRLI